MKTDKCGCTVTVYGAGIAGLTVAHELAERGWEVRVVEPGRGYRPAPEPVVDMAIGGMARTQYVGLPSDKDDHKPKPRRCNDLHLGQQLPRPAEMTITVHSEDECISDDEAAKIDRRLKWCLDRGLNVQKVLVHGNADNVADAEARARKVKAVFARLFVAHRPEFVLPPIGTCKLEPFVSAVTEDTHVPEPEEELVCTIDSSKPWGVTLRRSDEPTGSRSLKPFEFIERLSTKSLRIRVESGSPIHGSNDRAPALRLRRIENGRHALLLRQLPRGIRRVA